MTNETLVTFLKFKLIPLTHTSMPFYKKGKTDLTHSQKLELLAQRNGLKHAIFSDAGDKYVGEWRNNKKSGKGVLISNNNEVIYEGDFRNNYPHGYGVAAHKIPNTNVFETKYRGFWKCGKQDATGVRVYVNGGFYIGNWKEGLRDGYGQMWYTDGSYFEGQWSKGVRQGLGVLVYENGNKYDGSWKNSEKHGRGIMYFLTAGQVQHGIWRNNICVFSTISMLPFRQTAINPSKFPIPPNYLVNMDEVCRKLEEKALKGEHEECLNPEEEDSVSESSITKKST
ncbi:MORN repeat-containing protein 3 [Leptinotarsa decemlineata]|uniref:MORN repeat-containing protein 3 n=1 Tax=Leptinotarsa decemlineata TaxID=7539 RepID=UPI000C2555C2|nr:MORN repeat-containing protein 3-like [Leptinotarsa decemlineata]